MMILYNFSHPPMSTQFYRFKTIDMGIKIPCQYLHNRQGTDARSDFIVHQQRRVFCMPDSSKHVNYCIKVNQSVLTIFQFIPES